MRRMGGNRKTISATPRQLESLIRLAEARAKIRFSDVVDSSDVAEAIRLMNVATQRAATDPRTGTIDMDMINTGRSAVDRESLVFLAGELRNLLGGYKGSNKRFTVFEVRAMINEQSTEDVTVALLQEALRELANEDKRPINFDMKSGRVTVV
jgi:DNA replication licensing factor MCM4